MGNSDSSAAPESPGGAPSSVSIKLVLLGPAGVGKSTAFRRILSSHMRDGSSSGAATQRATAGLFQIELSRGCLLQAAVWDTPPSSVGDSSESNDLLYIADADVVFLVVDSSASGAESMRFATSWCSSVLPSVQRQRQLQDHILPQCYLLANKCDSPTCVWTPPEIAAMTTDLGLAGGLLVSARTGEGIEAAVLSAFRSVLEARLSAAVPPPLVAAPVSLLGASRLAVPLDARSISPEANAIDSSREDSIDGDDDLFMNR